MEYAADDADAAVFVLLFGARGLEIESFLYTLNRSRDWHKKMPQVNLDYYWPASW